MKNWASKFVGVMALGFLLGCISTQNVQALELDWSGQFWSEFNFVHNYAMDASDQGAGYDPDRAAGGGYYVPGGGRQDASFQSLFLRIRPKIVVNDTIYIKSEWWLGSPIFGMFGNSVPYNVDQRQYNSYQSRGSSITAQRFWGEFITDIGTFQVGRVPLHWGLGIVWNSGDNLWDRYMSTGDAIRWIAKFGSFSFVPSFIINSAGNSIGGSCNVTGSGTCVPGVGGGGTSDYSILLKYEDVEGELEGGINIIKRLTGANQDPVYGMLNPQSVTGSMNYLTYDFFAKKRFSKLTLGAEVPVTSGTLGPSNYQSFAIAGEADWKPTEVWELMLKAGYASGQGNLSSTSIDTYNAFFFNPSYHIGMIMFNYQLRNFSGAQTLNNPTLAPNQLASPYDNPIVNATYLAFSTYYKPWDKWTFRPGFVYAVAPQKAAAGQYFLNTWSKSVQLATQDQGADLGWELDLGVTFQWDEYFQFSVDNGIFFPGSFYAFSNTPNANATSAVFGTSIRVGINF